MGTGHFQVVQPPEFIKDGELVSAQADGPGGVRECDIEGAGTGLGDRELAFFGYLRADGGCRDCGRPGVDDDRVALDPQFRVGGAGLNDAADLDLRLGQPRWQAADSARVFPRNCRSRARETGTAVGVRGMPQPPAPRSYLPVGALLSRASLG